MAHKTNSHEKYQITLHKFSILAKFKKFDSINYDPLLISFLLKFDISTIFMVLNNFDIKFNFNLFKQLTYK